MTDQHDESARGPQSAAGVLRRLREAGLAPRKRRGQHFLHDPRLLRAVVEEAGITDQDRVFEVGTGPGTLTRHLAGRAARVLTVEIDPEMAAFAARDLGSPDHVTFFCADVLEGRQVNPRVEKLLRSLQPFVWVSNLPYSVAATLVVAVLESELAWMRATLLVQKEVADRLAARPGDRAYGPLTLLVAFWARVRRGREVSRGAFWPPPRVRSSFVHLDPSGPLGPRQDYRAYAAWVRRLFGHRRKQLGALLKKALGPDRAARALATGRLAPQTRPELLEPRDFLCLAREFPMKVV